MKTSLERANAAYDKLIEARAGKGSYSDVVAAYDAWRAALAPLNIEDQTRHINYMNGTEQAR